MRCPICQKPLVKSQKRLVCFGTPISEKPYLFWQHIEINQEWYVIYFADIISQQEYSLYSHNGLHNTINLNDPISNVRSRPLGSNDNYDNLLFSIQEYFPITFETDKETIINPIPRLLKLIAFG